jgi:uncharacterized protein with GYD domain
MSTFIMLTRLSHEGLKSPRSLETLGKAVSQRIKSECPDVEWIASYAVLGPADYVDVFSAPNIETATKVATIVRTFGHATTEVWGATPWKEFLGMVRDLPPAEFLMEGR